MADGLTCDEWLAAGGRVLAPSTARRGRLWTATPLGRGNKTVAGYVIRQHGLGMAFMYLPDYLVIAADYPEWRERIPMAQSLAGCVRCTTPVSFEPER